MTRTLVTLLATSVVLLAATGCDSGSTASDAPKGGALRPVQENKRPAPSVDSGGPGGALESVDPGAAGAAGVGANRGSRNSGGG